MPPKRYDFESDWPSGMGGGGGAVERDDGEYVQVADYADDVAELVNALRRECGNHTCVCALFGRPCETCQTNSVITKFAPIARLAAEWQAARAKAIQRLLAIPKGLGDVADGDRDMAERL